MPKYGLIVCFSPVIKVHIGEHKYKFDWYLFAKIGSWKIGKNQGSGDPKSSLNWEYWKKTPVAGNINYVRYLSMQKVNLN